jgi:hypothetical protein
VAYTDHRHKQPKPSYQIRVNVHGIFTQVNVHNVLKEVSNVMVLDRENDR